MADYSDRMVTLLAFLGKDPSREYTAAEVMEGTDIPRGTVSGLVARLVSTDLATQADGPLGTRPFKLTPGGIVTARSAAAPPVALDGLAAPLDPAKTRFYGSLAELAAAVGRGEETRELYELARRRIYGAP